MTVHNQTVFDIPLTWNRTRFEATRNKYRSARKLIEISINVQFEKQMRGVFSHNIEIEENINDINERLLKYHDKLRVLDNMIELASQSLRIYFDRRMEHVRAIVNEHCNIIQQIIHEEADHWKEIHSIMDQNLLNPGDVRSRNNHPRPVQKSPASNIITIEEENDDPEEHVSKLLNGKTLTPLLTQMIRKSRVQSKRLTLIPSIKINVPSQEEYSVPRRNERTSMRILPLSTARQTLDIVDTTFVVKPEETMIDGEIENEEPNGTYRAPHHDYHSHLLVTQPDRLLIDSQPHIPKRLCFSPTILQDPTDLPEDDVHDQSSCCYEKTEEPIRTILIPIDQNRTTVKQIVEDPHHFGQTFLLDIIKTEQLANGQNEYRRPTISDDDDDDVLVVVDINRIVSTTEHISYTTNDNSVPKSKSPIQQDSTAVQEAIKTKNRTRTAITKTKSKSVVVSARKTRSAAKVLAEREAATIGEKSIENKRKTRKRKQSKSIDRRGESTDDEDETIPVNSTHNRIKPKRRKKSRAESRSNQISDDDHNQLSTNSKRKTRKRTDDQHETTNDPETSKRKTRKPKEKDMLDTETTKRKTSTNDDEEKKTKVKKRKQKTKKSKKDDDEEQVPKRYSTRSSAKRNPRTN